MGWTHSAGCWYLKRAGASLARGGEHLLFPISLEKYVLILQIIHTTVLCGLPDFPEGGDPWDPLLLWDCPAGLCPCFRTEQQTLPGAPAFISCSGSSSSQMSCATAVLSRKYLVQTAFEARNYLKQILSEENSLWSGGIIWLHPPKAGSLFFPQRIIEFILLTSLIDRVSSHSVLISQCWPHQFLRWERWGEIPPEVFRAEIHWEGQEGADFSLFCISAKHKGLCAPQSFILDWYFALKHPKCRTGLAGHNYKANVIWKANK